MNNRLKLTAILGICAAAFISYAGEPTSPPSLRLQVRGENGNNTVGVGLNAGGSPVTVKVAPNADPNRMMCPILQKAAKTMITLDVKDANVSDVLDMVAKSSDIAIQKEGEMPDVKMTLKFTDETVFNALGVICKTAKLVLRVNDAGDTLIVSPVNDSTRGINFGVGTTTTK